MITTELTPSAGVWAFFVEGVARTGEGPRCSEAVPMTFVHEKATVVTVYGHYFNAPGSHTGLKSLKSTIDNHFLDEKLFGASDQAVYSDMESSSSGRLHSSTVRSGGRQTIFRHVARCVGV